MKDEGETEMDIQISFNTLSANEDWLKVANETIAAVQASDASGLIDGDKLNLWRLSSVDPMLGEMITTSQAQGSEKIIKEVRSDISDMASGFAVSPAKTQAEARLKVCQDYIQEQQQVEAAQVQTMLGQSPQFQQYLNNYMEVLQREVQQGQNAQIGRNEAPMMVGNMNVEGINGTAQ